MDYGKKIILGGLKFWRFKKLFKITFLGCLLTCLCLMSVNALVFKGADNLELCVILPNGSRTCLNNTNLVGVNTTGYDITLELYNIKKERSYINIYDFIFNNIIEFFFLLIIILFILYFVYAIVS